MKISGAEFLEWHEKGWPEGWIWADESTLDDGRDIYAAGNTPKKTVLSVAPDEIFVVPDWWAAIPEEPKEGEEDGATICTLIRRWRKKRDTAFVGVEVKKADLNGVLSALRRLPVKIVFGGAS